MVDTDDAKYDLAFCALTPDRMIVHDEWLTPGGALHKDCPLRNGPITFSLRDSE
jgi:hypothetical protein